MTIKDILEKFKDYTTLDRFNPVEKIVYGFVGLILTAVVVAGLTFIIKK